MASDQMGKWILMSANGCEQAHVGFFGELADSKNSQKWSYLFSEALVS